MVNYRRVVCEVALVAALVTITTAVPVPTTTGAYYDQRQTGSENYRLNIDGVLIAVVPAETLLSAASELDLSGLLDLDDLSDFEFAQKPQKPATSSSTSIPAWLLEGGKPSKPEASQEVSKPEEAKPQESEAPAKPAEAPAKPAEAPAKPAEAPITAPTTSEVKSKKDTASNKREKAQR